MLPDVNDDVYQRAVKIFIRDLIASPCVKWSRLVSLIQVISAHRVCFSGLWAYLLGNGQDVVGWSSLKRAASRNPVPPLASIAVSWQVRCLL